MGQLITLLEVIQKLDSFDAESTIYAAKPWTRDAKAMIAMEPVTGGLPAAVAAAGLQYFLEVFISRDVLEGWATNLKKPPTSEEKCERLIQYAVNDA